MRRRKLSLLAIALITCVLLFSCSQYTPALPSDMAKSGTWEDLFKALWTGLSDNYVFWDLDDSNGEWDRVYEEFLPRFRELGKIDTKDDETTRKGTILLFDSVKNLSDGHFSIEAFGSSFSPYYYRLMKEYHPELSDQEVLENLYDFYSNYMLLPADYLFENATSIMANTFRIPLSFKIRKGTLDPAYSSLYYSWYNQDGNIVCIAVNPKIQLRTPMNGESVILYSSAHPYGSVTTDNGTILDFTSSDNYDNPESEFPGEDIASYGPYYPVSDLSWGSETQDLDSFFADWTLCLVLDTKAEYDEDDNTYKKSVSLKLNALAAITKESGGAYSPNTVYFLSSGFDFYPQRNQSGMKQFLMDFHGMKMDGNAKGMILDMRGNSGGYNYDRELLFGDMFTEPQLIGYQKNKTGSGRLDLSLEYPLYIYPEAEFYNNDFSDIASKPIAVITNCATASNGEMAVFMVKALTNGGQVGGRTRGANGTLEGSILSTNSGQFSIGDYITSVYTPYGNIRDTHHVSYEGKGLIPDEGYVTEFNQTEFLKGTDERLMKAFGWINDHM